MILLPILLTGLTVTGLGSGRVSSAIEFPTATKPVGTLLAAATAAARRDAPSIGPMQPLRPVGARAARPAGRPSMATRATAIFAGAVVGSLAGILAGATLDQMTSGGECPTFASYGMPIGAAIGGVLTARWVQ